MISVITKKNADSNVDADGMGIMSMNLIMFLFKDCDIHLISCYCY